MLTWVSLSTKSLEHNLKQFSKLVGPRVALMPVIKSNAYGHGFLQIARLCASSPLVDRLCVVSLDEALLLRKNGVRKPILVLSIFDLDEEQVALGIRKNIAFPLYNEVQAKILGKVAEKLGKKVRVHLKIDTGMSRLGVLPTDALGFYKKLKRLRFVVVEALWTHLSSSESSKEVTSDQITVLDKTVALFEREGIYIPFRHVACSASTVLYPESHAGGVRVGIGLYGLYSTQERDLIDLKPVLSWHTTVIDVKQLPPGARIGYGGTYTTLCPTRLAVLPVGYYDGYDRRSLSNKGTVLIKGKRCPVRGNVCMNMIMVDVTAVPGVTVGDTATLIGKNGKEEVTADELADLAGTINYEIVTRINSAIPRITV